MSICPDVLLYIASVIQYKVIKISALPTANHRLNMIYTILEIKILYSMKRRNVNINVVDKTKSVHFDFL